ncbi:hypothetical protein EIP91_003446 [Steccherinum ochraceum]|uniref:DUF6534 domain-containing protein n=1 Tax=Steccherinum ochraceum TaxID=92696 RepID=A0A4R0RAF8_9APHY|nr:hypothetical protein EIP91_003446 [Steccherinum ochraceum]
MLLGPALLAHLFNYGLLGILTVQVYLYYIAFPNDRYKYKITVGVVFVFELAQVSVATYDAFRMFASGWGNFVQADEIGLYWMSGPLMIETLGAFCQCFYTQRIYALGRNYSIVTPICFLSVLQFAFGVYAAVEVHNSPELSSGESGTVRIAGLMWSCTAIACNTLITCSMFYHLWKAKRASPVKRSSTSSTLSRMMLYTVETGFIAVATSIMALVCYAASQSTSLWFLWMMVIGKLYSNCLVAVLNARVRIEGGRELYPNHLPEEPISIRTAFDVSRPPAADGLIGNRRCEGQGIIVEMSHVTETASTLSELKANKNVESHPDVSLMA